MLCSSHRGSRLLLGGGLGLGGVHTEGADYCYIGGGLGLGGVYTEGADYC